MKSFVFLLWSFVVLASLLLKARFSRGGVVSEEALVVSSSERPVSTVKSGKAVGSPGPSSTFFAESSQSGYYYTCDADNNYGAGQLQTCFDNLIGMNRAVKAAYGEVSVQDAWHHLFVQLKTFLEKHQSSSV